MAFNGPGGGQGGGHPLQDLPSGSSVSKPPYRAGEGREDKAGRTSLANAGFCFPSSSITCPLTSRRKRPADIFSTSLARTATSMTDSALGLLPTAQSRRTVSPSPMLPEPRPSALLAWAATADMASTARELDTTSPAPPPPSTTTTMTAGCRDSSSPPAAV